MARDKFSQKIAHSLYPVSLFYKKFADAGWRDKEKRIMQSQEDPGLADSLLISRWRVPVFVEHKTGDGASRERFTFANWNERQRLFCVACAYSRLPYWIFLVMGESVRAKRYPLVAFLITGEQMFDLERKAGNRKSLSYATALTLLKGEQLVWVPRQDRWDIPERHPFQLALRGNHERRNCGDRKTGTGGERRSAPVPDKRLRVISNGSAGSRERDHRDIPVRGTQQPDGAVPTA